MASTSRRTVELIDSSVMIDSTDSSSLLLLLVIIIIIYIHNDKPFVAQAHHAGSLLVLVERTSNDYE